MQKMSKTEKKRLHKVDSTKQQLLSALSEKYEGFSVVFRYLAELQKPLILHNCFLDLILIYKQVCKTKVNHEGKGTVKLNTLHFAGYENV